MDPVDRDSREGADRRGRHQADRGLGDSRWRKADGAYNGKEIAAELGDPTLPAPPPGRAPDSPIFRWFSLADSLHHRL